MSSATIKSKQSVNVHNHIYKQNRQYSLKRNVQFGRSKSRKSMKIMKKYSKSMNFSKNYEKYEHWEA